MDGTRIPCVLVVEDELPILDALIDLLHTSGFGAEGARTLREAEGKLSRGYDLLLLDLSLPDGDGLDLCSKLRRDGSALPIVVLTARDSSPQKVRGLDLGADDYITKPFDSAELVARVRSVLRRALTPVAGRLSLGELWLDPETRTAGRGDHDIQLKPREFDLLHFLMRRPGRAWTRDQLLEHVWGHGFEGDSRTVDLHIGRLRTKIEIDSSTPCRIKTVWGVGYRMIDTRRAG